MYFRDDTQQQAVLTAVTPVIQTSFLWLYHALQACVSMYSKDKARLFRIAAVIILLFLNRFIKQARDEISAAHHLLLLLGNSSRNFRICGASMVLHSVQNASGRTEEG